MRRMIPFLIALICFILTILEGTFALNLLSFLPEKWMMVNHFMLIFLLYVAIFFERPHTYYAVILAITFGLIIDIVYTNVIGVYIFSYTAIIYMVRVIMKFLQSNFLIAMSMTVLGVLAADLMTFFVYQLIQVHNMSWEIYWQNRMLPTVIGNIIIGLLLYLLFAKKLEKWSKIKFDQSE